MEQAKMKRDQQIDEIINQYANALSQGEETVDKVVSKYPQFAEDLRPRLEALQWLHSSKGKLEPRNNFVTSSRKSFEQQISAIKPGNFWKDIFHRYSSFQWAFYITAPTVIIVMLALIINSLMLTARMSIPGEPLYSTKLVLEDVQLALTADPVKKADLYLQFSKERTTEFVELVLNGDYEALPAAAARLEIEMTSSLRSLTYVKTHGLANGQPDTMGLKYTLSNEIFMLTVLKESSPSSAYSGIDLAIQIAQSGLFALR
jgi:hypothetical protein